MEQVEPEFVVFEAEGDTFRVAPDATVSYHRKMLPKERADGVKEALVYDVHVHGEKDDTEIVFVPQIHEREEEVTHIPAWLRKEKKRDKRAWREIHQTFRRTIKWMPEYFESLPEVPRAERKYPDSE